MGTQKLVLSINHTQKKCDSNEEEKTRKDAINIKICSIATVHTQHSIQFKIQYVKNRFQEKIVRRSSPQLKKEKKTNNIRIFVPHLTFKPFKLCI